ncbi:MAG: hypothetical protein AAGI49_06395 [Bacteroidota bacterium]
MRTFNENIPVDDHFEREPESDFDVEDMIEDFCYRMESNYFLSWEAVEAQERNEELGKHHKKLLSDLISFEDEPSDQIHYIDGMPRPSKKWYEIAVILAKLLEKGRLKTFETYTALISEGWGNLKEAIEFNSDSLSKPKGVETGIDVIPLDLYHRLEIQESMDALLGLGQDDDEDLTLKNEDQHYRIEMLVDDLKEKIQSVEHVKLSIETIISDWVEMKKADEDEFKKLMCAYLSLASTEELLVSRLKEEK